MWHPMKKFNSKIVSNPGKSAASYNMVCTWLHYDIGGEYSKEWTGLNDILAK